MAFREKTAWISLLSTLIIYGLYFWSVVRTGQQMGSFHLGSLIGTIVALVIVQVALIVVAAIFSPKDAQAPRDEREKLIELRAIRIGYFGLAMGVLSVCAVGAFYPSVVFNINALLFLLVAAEALRQAGSIVQYRRGA
ncbi:MAG: hypothetical protein WDM86_16295 [Rhizomicrobium sp.]